MASSSSTSSVDELVKLFYAAHLTSRKHERDLIVLSEKDRFKEKELEEIPPLRDLMCSPRDIGQSKLTKVRVSRSTTKEYLSNSTEKVPGTDATYSRIKSCVNNIFSAQYMDFTDHFDYKTKRILGFWDFENCPVPDTYQTLKDFQNLVSNIGKSLQGMGFTAAAFDVVGVGNTNYLDGYHALASKMSIFHENKLAANEKDTADKGLIVKMREGMENHLEMYKEPATILLMTGDIDFLGVIAEAKKLGFYVLLAHNDSALPKLKNASSKPVKWSELAKKRVQPKVAKPGV